MSALVGGAHISFYRQWAAAGMNKQIPLASTTFGAATRTSSLSPEEAQRHHRRLRLSSRSIDTPANKDFLESLHDK